MATISQLNSGTYTISCTYCNLTTGSYRVSTAIDASGGGYLDALVMVGAGLATGGTTGNDNAVYVYFYGKLQGASGYSDIVSGADAAYTPRSVDNLRGPYAIYFPTATAAPEAMGGPWSVANAFGGAMPSMWGVVIRNYTNVTLGTATACQISYMKVWNTVA